MPGVVDHQPKYFGRFTKKLDGPGIDKFLVRDAKPSYPDRNLIRRSGHMQLGCSVEA
jgi:hypothetical protein